MNSSPELPASAAGASAGQALRSAREKLGMPIEALSASLKVSTRKLELMEADRHDELPGATFTRALALSMCRVLKIDSEPILARLPLPVDQSLDSVTMGLNKPFKERSGRSLGDGLLGLLNGQVIAAGLLVAGAAAVYWLPMNLWPRLGDSAATRIVTGPAPTAGSAAASAALVAQAPQPAAVVPASTAPAPAASAMVETVFSAPAAPADGPVAGGVLMLRAAAESWIEVRDGAGRILLSRSLAPGEAAGLDGSLPLRVVVGNAEATQVTFRGQPVALAATRDNVARLELK